MFVPGCDSLNKEPFNPRFHHQRLDCSLKTAVSSQDQTVPLLKNSGLGYIRSHCKQEIHAKDYLQQWKFLHALQLAYDLH